MFGLACRTGIKSLTGRAGIVACDYTCQYSCTDRTGIVTSDRCDYIDFVTISQDKQQAQEDLTLMLDQYGDKISPGVV